MRLFFALTLSPTARAALRQAPDVILLGEMRDYETISIAMTAAETGHLVISTLHTTGAANTIDRIIDIFPANAQQQIRVQLSMVLQAVVSQQLVPTTDGRLTPAFELMFVNKAIRNMIRVAHNEAADQCLEMEKKPGVTLQDLMPIISGAVGREAYRTGDTSKGMFSVGQDIGLISDVKPAKEIVEELVRDAAAAADRLASIAKW